MMWVLINYKLNNVRIQIKLIQNMLSQTTSQTLSKFGVNAENLSEMASGVKLADAVNNIFYGGSNSIFMTKVIKQNEHRKGNNVINMNIILKQIQKDQNIQCPPEIQSLTSFSMTQDPQKLSLFIEWLVKEGNKTVQSQRRVEQPAEVEENPFENVYFGVQFSPQKQSNDVPSLQTEKVVKKGSFKLIRPKHPLISQTFENSPKQSKEINRPEERDCSEDRSDLSPRKTVLKMIEKPPIYPQLHKEKTKQQKQKNQYTQMSNFSNSPAPFSCQRKSESCNSERDKESRVKYIESIHKKNQYLQEEVMNMSAEIENERRKISMKSESKRRVGSSQKKIFKVDIDDVMDWERKEITEWLVKTNLLSVQVGSHFQNLHEICKNGIIFPEIVNRHKGRGTDISYFKSPKRAAEINANYQKVFNYLKDLPSFSSDLMFLYEYFVPEPQERAFWSLLKSVYKCFTKKFTSNNKNSLFSRDSQIKEKMSRTQSVNLTSKKSLHSQKKEIAFDKMKLGINSTTKEKKKVEKIMSKPSIQFIKEIPDQKFKHEELVQKEEPIEGELGTQGYRQLHEMKKNYVANTPKKRTNHDASLTRSRIFSMNSIKRSGQKIAIPSINLEMEMKALKFLKQKKYTSFFERQDKELFRDPVRNGTLLNEIITKETEANFAYCKRPKNIQDCRQNQRIALKMLKKQIPQIPLAYEHHLEEIIKGQISLFYGLVWYLTNNKTTEKVENHSVYQIEVDNSQENILLWIRALEQNNSDICKLRIRDYHLLQNAITNSNLLYKIAAVIIPQKYVLKPTYEQPVNTIEQEANLKKILSFLMQNKVLKNDYVWKVKSVVKKDRYIIKNLMNDLMSYYMSKQNQNEDSQRLTFMKYMRKNSNQHRAYERLQTTTANQSFGIPFSKEENQIKQDQSPLEIAWVRKLGFNGDLSLNNGVILCHLISRLTMQSIVGIKENPQSKAECLTNIRKALKQISKFKWDEQDIVEADRETTLEIYKFIKEKFKHSYAMKGIF